MKTPDVEGPVYRPEPHSLEAEQALLGAILVHNEAHDRVSDFLEARHFRDPLHQVIYETASKLIASGKRADPITLKPLFQNVEPIDANTTVPQYIGRLAANATTIINVRDYGRTVHDLATRRQLILIGEDLVNAAYDSPVDFSPKEQIEEAERRLYVLAEGSEHQAEVTASAMYATAVRRIEMAHKGGGPAGLSTRFRALDAKPGKLQPGHLIILAGRPSMGKTSLANGIVHNQADAAVHFFSAEMTAEEIGLRIISAEIGIPTDKLRSGELDEAQWRQLLPPSRSSGSSGLWSIRLALCRSASSPRVRAGSSARSAPR